MTASARGVPPDPLRLILPVHRTLGLVAVLILVVAVVTAGGASLYEERREQARRAADLARLAATQVERMVEAIDLLLVVTADEAAATDWSDAGQKRRATSQMRARERLLPYIFRVNVYGPDGWARVGSTDVLPTVSVADREYFQAHRPSDSGLFISRQYRAFSTGEPIFVLSRRVSAADGGFAGVVALSLAAENFGAFHRSLEIGSGSALMIMGSDQDILVREPPTFAEGNRVPEDLAEAIRRGRSGRLDVASGEGTWLGTMLRVGAYPLWVYVATAVDAIHAAWLRESIPFMAAALFGLALLVALTVYALRRARGEDAFRAALIEAKSGLEAHVAERTAALSAALTQKDVFLRETHHRVKNNLQVVASLLGLQKGVVDAAARAALDDSLRRVYAMSAIHEQLYAAPDVAAIDLDPYLHTLCSQIADAYVTPGQTIAIEIRSVPVLLDLDTATPVALIVNEVVSNVFKHAFVGRDRGQLEIEVQLDGGTVVLVVRDDGVGMGEAPSGRASMGVRIVRALVSQIGGEHTLASQGGTVFTLRFPRPNMSSAS